MIGCLHYVPWLPVSLVHISLRANCNIETGTTWDTIPTYESILELPATWQQEPLHIWVNFANIPWVKDAIASVVGIFHSHIRKVSQTVKIAGSKVTIGQQNMTAMP